MLQQTCFFNIAVKLAHLFGPAVFFGKCLPCDKRKSSMTPSNDFCGKKAKLPEEKNSEIGIFRQ